MIYKQKPSGFFGTNMTSYLTLLGCDSVIVTGTTTSGCVRATVLDAFSLNYRISLAEEGCFDRSQASHAINLCDMNAKYADVVKTSEVLEFFDTLPAELVRPAEGLAGRTASVEAVKHLPLKAMRLMSAHSRASGKSSLLRWVPAFAGTSGGDTFDSIASKSVARRGQGQRSTTNPSSATRNPSAPCFVAARQHGRVHVGDHGASAPAVRGASPSSRWKFIWPVTSREWS